VPGYQTTKFIGAGAYGEVWAGVDRNTGRKVAIKFYAHRSGVDWSLLNREVEKLRFLSADRYVVQLLQVGWTAEPPYYVMELVESGSLDDLLKQHGTFSVHEAVDIFREIAIGLAHAHGKGILHCDLKPANILLDQDQRPRLADFGQSRLSHEQKPALGTLFYMAPEQADLEAAPDVRWDVYALGAILHCLLVGYPPHRNDATVGKIDSASDLKTRLASYRHAIRSAPPPADHRRVRGMDRVLADIIERCLATNPHDRFANVQEVLDALADRDRNRAQLPLLVLGFVGPLLVLAITAFFSWRGYERAVINAEAGYRSWALESNGYAAHLAAEKVTSEIARYFEIARDEAVQGVPTFVEALSSPTLEQLSDPTIPEAELATLREKFKRELERVQLDNYLLQRLRVYAELAEQDPRAPRFASIFLTDRYGTQVAAAFDDDTLPTQIGHSVAYRTYFHGGPVDLPEESRGQLNGGHITRTQLSAVFLSKSQGKWKVAIATPIYRDLDGHRQFEGVLVLTVNLGTFDLGQSDMAPSENRFAVLVDGRQAAERGTILQHPLLAEVVSTQSTLKEDLQSPRYRVASDILDKQASESYTDPMGRHPKGGNYNRRWLAAAAPVLPPVDAGENSQSGLVVIVQSDYASVVGPARELGNQFIRNSLWMLAVVIAVSLALWYIVVRLFREPRAAPRIVGPTSDSTPLHGMSTLAAPTRKVE
jgi:hypothetical protein